MQKGIVAPENFREPRESRKGVLPGLRSNFVERHAAQRSRDSSRFEDVGGLGLKQRFTARKSVPTPARRHIGRIRLKEPRVGWY